MPKNKIIPYRPELKLLARQLRKNSTLAEVLLWCEIKGKQLLGYQFHRQVPMLDYIVDFYCHELALAIEVDGESHAHEDTAANDITRQQRLEAEGVCFLRFDDLEVKQNLASVVNEIYHWIEENTNDDKEL
ncbi:DNA methylase [marine bacterium AO1-C]|nr:DNA methylase [marine bacterium AO1-C]